MLGKISLLYLILFVATVFTCGPSKPQKDESLTTPEIQSTTTTEKRTTTTTKKPTASTTTEGTSTHDGETSPNTAFTTTLQEEDNIFSSYKTLIVISACIGCGALGVLVCVVLMYHKRSSFKTTHRKPPNQANPELGQNEQCTTAVQNPGTTAANATKAENSFEINS